MSVVTLNLFSKVEILFVLFSVVHKVVLKNDINHHRYTDKEDFCLFQDFSVLVQKKKQVKHQPVNNNIECIKTCRMNRMLLNVHEVFLEAGL